MHILQTPNATKSPMFYVLQMLQRKGTNKSTIWLIAFLFLGFSFLGVAQETDQSKTEDAQYDAGPRAAQIDSVLRSKQFCSEPVDIYEWNDFVLEREMLYILKGGNLDEASLSLQDARGREMHLEYWNEFVYFSLPKDETYTLFQEDLCGNRIALKSFVSQPQDLEVPVALSENMFRVIGNRSKDQSLYELFSSETSVSAAAKYSFLQKYIAKNAIFLNKNEILDAVLHALLKNPGTPPRSNRVEFLEATKADLNPGNHPFQNFIRYIYPNEVIPLSARDCNCMKFETFSNLNFSHVNMQAGTSVNSVNQSQQFSSSVLTSQEIDGQRHYGHRYLESLGASVYVNVWDKGYIARFSSANPGIKENTLTNLHISPSISDPNPSFYPAPTEHQVRNYLLLCSSSLDQLPSECQCEKSVDVRFMSGFKLRMKTAINQSGSNRSAFASVFASSVATVYYHNQRRLEVVSGASAIQESHSSSIWSNNWTNHISNLANSALAAYANTYTVFLPDSTLDPNSINQVVANSSDANADFLNAFTSQPDLAYASSSDISKNANLYDKTKTFYIEPNNIISFMISTHYNVEIKGEKSWKNEVELNIDAGMRTLWSSQGNGVVFTDTTVNISTGIATVQDYETSGELCCSPLYADYTLSSIEWPGATNTLAGYHSKIKSTIGWPGFWLPEFYTTDIFWLPNELIIGGNVGKYKGDLPPNCPNPLLTPFGKRAQSQHTGVVLQEHNSLVHRFDSDARFTVFDTWGREIYSISTKQGEEMVMDNIAQYKHQILFVHVHTAQSREVHKLMIQ